MTNNGYDMAYQDGYEQGFKDGSNETYKYYRSLDLKRALELLDTMFPEEVQDLFELTNEDMDMLIDMHEKGEQFV